jgi:hypothetical protein
VSRIHSVVFLVVESTPSTSLRAARSRYIPLIAGRARANPRCRELSVARDAEAIRI